MGPLPYTDSAAAGGGPAAAEDEVGRAPGVDRRQPRSGHAARLQPGCPAAPEDGRLPLLPSGPDGVHGPSLRETRLSTSGDDGGGRRVTTSTGNSAPL